MIFISLAGIINRAKDTVPLSANQLFFAYSVTGPRSAVGLVNYSLMS